MGKVTTSIDIDASPEDVWAVVTALRRLGDWVTIHKDFPEPPPDEVSKGVIFEQTLALAGTAFDVEWTAKSVEESKRLEWGGKGPAGTKARTVAQSLVAEDAQGAVALIFMPIWLTFAVLVLWGADALARVVASRVQRRLTAR